MSVAGIGSDPLQLNPCISPVFFSCLFFGVWCHSVPAKGCQVILTLFTERVLRYRTDIFLSAPPIVSVVEMLLPRIMPFILSCWQPLMILVIKRGQCQQPQFFPAILFLGRVRIFFRPLDNNVVATFVSHYMITECVLASELVQVATWLS